MNREELLAIVAATLYAGHFAAKEHEAGNCTYDQSEALADATLLIDKAKAQVLKENV